MVENILDGAKTFSINRDTFRLGKSVSNSEVGLASLSIASFVLRLICTNGMISKIEVSASYPHVSLKILNEFPKVLDNLSLELGKQKDQFKISIERKWIIQWLPLKLSTSNSSLENRKKGNE